MQKINCAGMTVPFLTSVLRDYLKKQDLIITNYLIEPCSFKIGEGRRKKFYKLILEANQECPDLILKILPAKDGVIESTLDYHHREVAFGESNLYKKVRQIIQIPIITVYRDERAKEWWLLMEDVSPALKRIGPPKPPTADLVRGMLTSLGKFHALTWEQVNLAKEYPWLMNFNQWVRSGCKIILALIAGHGDEPWMKEFLQDKPGLLSGFPHFTNWLTLERKKLLQTFLESPDIILNMINQSPQALCHNDLFFPNLGWDNNKLLLIDWEFVGIAPTSWDVYSAYAGMPCLEIQEKEALDIYFQAIEEEGFEVNREGWLYSYQKLEVIEFLAFGLRSFVPIIFDPNSHLSEEEKKPVILELNRLFHVMERVYDEFK